MALTRRSKGRRMSLKIQNKTRTSDGRKSPVEVVSEGSRQSTGQSLKMQAGQLIGERVWSPRAEDVRRTPGGGANRNNCPGIVKSKT